LIRKNNIKKVEANTCSPRQQARWARLLPAMSRFVRRRTIHRQPFFDLMQRRTIRRDYKFILCSGKLFATTINSF